MNTEIQKRLGEMESKHEIKILYACESGSRGWGFPSPDSDYDVRFIYVQPCDRYLGIQEVDDSLEFAISDELDINGWDLRKALRLTGKSNTTVFEWLQSPVVYREAPGFKDALWDICRQYFCRRSNIFHYLGIAKGAMEALSVEGKLKIKKLFYILRPLLAASWCAERDEIVPMHITPLKTLLPADLLGIVNDLVLQKESAAEGWMINLPEQLKAWITETAASCLDKAGLMEKEAIRPCPAEPVFPENNTRL